MASLNVVELSKFRNGEYRWKIFERKLNNEETFEFTPEAQKRFGLKKDYLKPLDPDFFKYSLYKGYETGDFSALTGIKFQGEVSRCTIGLTNLQKTAEFGSSAGLGGGSEQTFYVERKTAQNCADLTGGEFQGYKQSELLADHTPEDTYWEQNLDESWKTSLSDIPQTIVSSSFTQNLPDYHHQDQLVKWIKDSYKKCKVGTHYQVRNFNKWNPADIWCSSGSVGAISSSLSHCSTLQDLKEVCYSPQLKGISLKKGGTEIKEVRWQNLPWEVEKWKYVGDIVKDSGKCLNIKFNFKGGEDKLLTIRPSGQTLRADVKTVGSDHRNGCCGLYQINASLAAQNLKFRFNMKKAIQSLQDVSLNFDDRIYRAVKSELTSFVQYFKYLSNEKQKLFISDLVRHCVCQSRDHCTYLKVS